MELISPAQRSFGDSDGKVVGKANLRAYFQRDWRLIQNCISPCGCALGSNSVVLTTQIKKGHTAEFMELSANGNVAGGG
jgi:hypothetical protein